MLSPGRGGAGENVLPATPEKPLKRKYLPVSGLHCRCNPGIDTSTLKSCCFAGLLNGSAPTCMQLKGVYWPSMPYYAQFPAARILSSDSAAKHILLLDITLCFRDDHKVKRCPSAAFFGIVLCYEAFKSFCIHQNMDVRWPRHIRRRETGFEAIAPVLIRKEGGSVVGIIFSSGPDLPHLNPNIWKRTAIIS